MTQQLTLVTLGVSDLESSIEFYKAVGYQHLPGTEGVAFFRTSTAVLGLFPRDELAADAGVPAEGSGFRGVSIACNQPSRADVDTTYEVWLAAGASAVKRPEAVFWGGYSSYLTDPDGHLWEIAHNPFMELDACGRLVIPAGE